MDISTNEVGDFLIIMIDGDIEMSTMKVMKEKIFKIVNENDKNIKIDFSKVDYLDSSGIGVLLTISKMQKNKGKSLKVINISEKISAILKLSSLLDVIEQ